MSRDLQVEQVDAEHDRQGHNTYYRDYISCFEQIGFDRVVTDVYAVRSPVFAQLSYPDIFLRLAQA